MFVSQSRSDLAEQNRLTTYFNDFTEYPLVINDQRTNEGLLLINNPPFGGTQTRYVIQSFTVTTAPVSYTLEIRDNGGPPIFTGSASATNTFTVDYPIILEGTHRLDFTLVSDSIFTPRSQAITIQEQYDSGFGWTNSGSPITYTCTSGTATASVIVPEQMPEMKVYDFVINLFKMHLLTSSITTELNGDETNDRDWETSVSNW